MAEKTPLGGGKTQDGPKKTSFHLPKGRTKKEGGAEGSNAARDSAGKGRSGKYHSQQKGDSMPASFTGGLSLPGEGGRERGEGGHDSKEFISSSKKGRGVPSLRQKETPNSPRHP